ncbi:MAG: TlpA family protein disulfide reductase [Actinomycetota bacterium]
MKTRARKTLRGTSLLAVVTILAVSCSGDADAPAAPTDPREVLHAEVASYDLAAGDASRFTVGLFTGDELFVSFGTVKLEFSYLGEKGATREPDPGPSVDGSFLLVPGTDPETIPDHPVAVPASRGRGVYAAGVRFDRSGFWEVEVTADIEGRGVRSATGAFQVLPEHRVPAPGERAIASDNLTAESTDAPASAIDSRARAGKKITDPVLHETTIAQAIRRGRPALVVFSTPVYCVSRFCGPITDMVEELAHDYSGRAEFIHVEIWRNFEKGVINETAAEWLLRDNDLREPWVFLFGSDGRILARWDNVATRGEIEPLLKRLPRTESSS